MRLPLYILAVSGGALVQCTVVPVVGVGGVVPDVPVVLTVLLALRYGPEAGCLTGFALGLAQDAVAGGPLGLHALSKALIGFAAGDLPRWILVRRPIGELFARVMVPQAGYNGILAVAALAWPVGRLLRR